MRQNRINALESEVVAYETDLERAQDELLELHHTTLDGYKIKIEGLQAKIDRPEPLFDFGRKGAVKAANKHARQANLGTAYGPSDSEVGNVLEYNPRTPGLPIDVSPTLDGGAGDFSVSLENATL